MKFISNETLSRQEIRGVRGGFELLQYCSSVHLVLNVVTI